MEKSPQQSLIDALPARPLTNSDKPIEVEALPIYKGGV
jgi:hypothetical protein